MRIQKEFSSIVYNWDLQWRKGMCVWNFVVFRFALPFWMNQVISRLIFPCKLIRIGQKWAQCSEIFCKYSNCSRGEFDYFLILLGKSSIWSKEKHFFLNYHFLGYNIKMCRKLHHSIWGIWKLHRSKDFQAMKVGKWAELPIHWEYVHGRAVPRA